jgi:hypothetical protein
MGMSQGSISHFEKPHALTALNLHSRHLQCAPEVSSIRRAKATLTPIKVSIVRLMHHQRNRYGGGIAQWQMAASI